MKRVRDESGYLRFIAYIAECGLEPEIRNICLRHSVTPRDTYLDTRGPTVHAARLEVWWWLTSHCRKSTSEVGRIFDRESTSITHAMTKLREVAAAMGKELDASAARESAVAIAEATLKTWQRVGEASAERFRKKKAIDGGTR